MKTFFSTVGYKDWELELVQAYPFLFKEPSLSAIIDYCSVYGMPINDQLPATFCNLRYGFCVEEKHKNKLRKIFDDLTDLLLFFREKPDPEFSLAKIYCYITDVKQLKDRIKIRVEKRFPDPIDKLVDYYLQYKTLL